MTDEAEHNLFRKRAKRCREMAFKAKTHQMKLQFLELSKNYEGLARDAEKFSEVNVLKLMDQHTDKR